MSHSVQLSLADGARWRISAYGRAAERQVSTLAAVMGLRKPGSSGGGDGALSNLRERALDVCTVRRTPHRLSHTPGGCEEPILFEPEGPARLRCLVGPASDPTLRNIQLLDLSLGMARHSQNDGALLVHGALIEREGAAVVLAGSSGAGKTTAVSRLPASWRAHSDDCTLIVRFPDGRCRGHPWPTWSRVFSGERGCSWKVEEHFPLRAILFLSRSESAPLAPVGQGQAACLLTELAEQVCPLQGRAFVNMQSGSSRLRLFDNSCALVRTVPCFSLGTTREGCFWEDIDRALKWGQSGAAHTHGSACQGPSSHLGQFVRGPTGDRTHDEREGDEREHGPLLRADR
jgi:SynChlorMet cassette protein ScmC